MIAPKPLNIVHTGFHAAKLKSLHDNLLRLRLNIKPAPTSLAPELLGPFVRKTKLGRKYHGKKIKDSYS